MVAFFVCVASNVVFAGCLAVFATALTSLAEPAPRSCVWLLVLFKLVTPPLIRVPVDSFTSGESTQSNHAIAPEPVSSDPLSPDGWILGCCFPIALADI